MDVQKEFSEVKRDTQRLVQCSEDYVHTYVCTYVRTYINTYVHTYMHTYVQYVCMYVDTYGYGDMVTLSYQVYVVQYW